MSQSRKNSLLLDCLPALAACVLAASAMAYDGPDSDKDPKKTSAQPAVQKPATAEAQASPEVEAAALAFVREHHPELAELVLRLKPMKPVEYQRAIRELARVSKNLAAIAARNPRLYELSLSTWKARSRVELVTAKLASASGPSPQLESELRQAVEDQLENEIRQQTFERDQAAERVKKLSDNVGRLESRRTSLVESRYQASVKKAQRARQRNGSVVAAKPKAKTKPSPGPKGQGQVETKLDTSASSADSATTTTKGEREP